jgi:hypothetical protein
MGGPKNIDLERFYRNRLERGKMNNGVITMTFGRQEVKLKQTYLDMFMNNNLC